MTRPRVVLLGGASGSGKSYLARRHGRPHLELDAYYHELSQDGVDGVLFPRTPYGEIDWDDPGTWNRQAAVDAVVELIETGRTLMPDYSITTSSVVGTRMLELGEASAARAVRDGRTGTEVIIAEGVFRCRRRAAAGSLHRSERSPRLLLHRSAPPHHGHAEVRPRCRRATQAHTVPDPARLGTGSIRTGQSCTTPGRRVHPGAQGTAARRHARALTGTSLRTSGRGRPRRDQLQQLVEVHALVWPQAQAKPFSDGFHRDC